MSPSLCPSDHSHVTSRECSLGTCPNVTRDPGYPAYVSPPGLGRAVTSLAERIFPYSMAPSSASRHQAASRAVYQVSSPGGEAGDNTSMVIVTPDWVTQAWGACSVSCGQGVKERQVRWSLSFLYKCTKIIIKVHCADVTGGGLLPDARCDHLTRPVSEEFCEAGACVQDTWLVGEWGPVRELMLIMIMVTS